MEDNPNFFTWTLEFKLVKEARKSGGDKYKTKLPNGKELFQYWDQSISRPEGKVVETLIIKVSYPEQFNQI